MNSTRIPVRIKVMAVAIILALAIFTMTAYERKFLVRADDTPLFDDFWSRLKANKTANEDAPTTDAAITGTTGSSEMKPEEYVYLEVTPAATALFSVQSAGNLVLMEDMVTGNLQVSKGTLRLISEVIAGINTRIDNQTDRIYESARRSRENLDLGLRIDNATAGSLVFASADDTLSALAAGSEGQLLVIDNGLPIWTNSDNVPTITGGELIVGNVTATSTSAASTFAHSISIASDAQYRIGGIGVLSRQANGAILGGITSGNARGSNALDIQSGRTNASQVASANFSLAAGYANTASGLYSLAAGYGNTAGAGYTAAVGGFNTASGYASLAFGSNNTVTVDLASAFGSNITNNIANSTMIGPSNSAKLTILASGNVGIGTTTPLNKLVVEDNQNNRTGISAVNTDPGTSALASISVSNGPDLENDGFGLLAMGENFDIGFPGALSNDTGILFSGPNLENGITLLSSSPTGALRFFTGGFLTSNERLTILSSGNIGIGTSTPTAQLSTTGSVRFSTFGAGALQTDANGNLLVSSDERLKDIVADYEAASSIEQLLGIQPITYKWTEASGFDTEAVYTGFSAQNVQLFIPEAVGEDSRGFLTLSDRPILATVINAIKEIWERLTQQQEQIDDLIIENEQLRVELEQIRQNMSGSRGGVQDSADVSPGATVTPEDELAEEVVIDPETITEADDAPVVEEAPSEALPDSSNPDTTEVI